MADNVRTATLKVRQEAGCLHKATLLREQGGDPGAIKAIRCDMSPASISGIRECLEQVQITFNEFRVIAHASGALDETCRTKQKNDPELRGLRWALLKSHDALNAAQHTDLALVACMTSKGTTHARRYREQLRGLPNRKQTPVRRALLRQWSANVNRSKVEAMKKMAKLIRRHLDGMVARVRTRQTNSFIEAVNGLIQTAKRIVTFLIAGKLNFSRVNPLLALPTRFA